MIKQQHINSKSFPYIDNLFDYGQFLKCVEAKGSIGKFPSNNKSHIAIIGAGLSGLIAAYELLRAGIKNITLFEAENNRCGGRLLSQRFDENQQCYIAEMGAMRFPSTEFGLFHYLDKYNIDTVSIFPDPGIVDTEIHYQGVAHKWNAGSKPPELFKIVDNGWKEFLNKGIQLSENQNLIAPLEIKRALEDGRLEEARSAWQEYLDVFGDSCFYSGLVKIFTGSNPPGSIRWRKPEDFALFGSLGIGSGGFQPVFRASFIEIMRLIVNGLEEDQRLVPLGISALSENILTDEFHGETIKNSIIYEKVTGIKKSDDNLFILNTENKQYAGFDRVIVTTSTRSMQISLKLSQSNTFLSHEMKRAVNETHLVGSSKLFLLTKNKFWLEKGLPHTILTDNLAKGIYCLDYDPENKNGCGVVLISYTWEDDSHKLITLKDKEKRLEYLVDELKTVAPDFASYLKPLNNDPKYILEYDWLTDENAMGAFKLNYPGDDIYSKSLFFQFQTASQAEQDTGLYLAGCSCSFTGGWAEGAVQTSLNAVCAVIKSLGGNLIENNPLDNMNSYYNY